MWIWPLQLFYLTTLGKGLAIPQVEKYSAALSVRIKTVIFTDLVHQAGTTDSTNKTLPPGSRDCKKFLCRSISFSSVFKWQSINWIFAILCTMVSVLNAYCGLEAILKIPPMFQNGLLYLDDHNFYTLSTTMSLATAGVLATPAHHRMINPELGANMQSFRITLILCTPALAEKNCSSNTVTLLPPILKLRKLQHSLNHTFGRLNEWFRRDRKEFPWKGNGSEDVVFLSSL